MNVERALDKVISAFLFGGWLLMISGGMALANESGASPSAQRFVINLTFLGVGLALLGFLMIPLYLIVPRNAEINLPSISVDW